MTSLKLVRSSIIEISSDASDGKTIISTHDLNSYLGNKDGKFDTSDKKFFQTAKNLELRENQLLAELLTLQLKWQRDEVYIQAEQAYVENKWTHNISIKGTGYSKLLELDREHPNLNVSGTDDCRNLRLYDSSTLVAHCRRNQEDSSGVFGSYLPCHINLDCCLGNRNGCFDVNGANFSSSAREVRLLGYCLSAELKSINGQWHHSEICLDQVIRCQSGHLESVLSKAYCGCKSYRLQVTQSPASAPKAAESFGMEPLQSLYNALKPDYGSLRLCCIQAGDWSDPIACHLSSHALDNCGPYTCLSYVWGEDRDSQLIHLNSHPFTVSSNLFCALRRLRWHGFQEPIWIDAICIDQQNEREKSAQVAQMSSIYAKAKQVLVWFGEIEALWESLLANVRPSFRKQWLNGMDKILCDWFRCLSADCHIWEAPGISHITAQGQERHNAPYTFSKWSLGGVVLLFCLNPWFNRIWVVQEYILSQKPILLFGAETLEWRVVREAIENSSRHYEGCCANIHQEWIWDFTLQHINVMRGRVQEMHSAETCMDLVQKSDRSHVVLLYLFQLGRGKESSDPRDKLFALYDCAKTAFGDFVPDYSHPTAEVFEDFTFNMIQQMQSFDIWDIATSRNDKVPLEDLQDLHSWAIDWTHHRFNISDRVQNLRNASTPRDRIPLSAGKNIAHLTTDRTLVIRGRNVATVASIGSEADIPSTNATREMKEITPVLIEWFKFVSSSNQMLEQKVRTIAAMFWKTILGDYTAMDPHNALVPIPPRDDSWRRINASDVDIWDAWLCKQIEKDGDLDTQHPVLRPLRHTIRFRRIFLTHDGHVGLGPSWVLPGDVVSVVEGARTPVIFRRHQDAIHQTGTEAYKLVGPCFAYGIMEKDWSDSCFTHEIQVL